ncbi:DUF456 domain-containing protein [uncultured Legionella sp.]|uniref:DUF456 domain-containing protein n=1 Tax=uncultured Legionella sp. TaxID=210934 RepID=UPI0026332CBE|nr:DUF456 domain-containing protein [uncultured Legionella sp.]
MALTAEIQRKSYNALLLRFKAQLNETDEQLLSLINDIAAANNIALNRQNDGTLNQLIKLIKSSKSEKNKDLTETAFMIYNLITELMAEQSAQNLKKHLSAGRFDLTPLHLRTLRDQMQDHDMSLSMPRSTGTISVLAVLNQHDPGSAFAIQDTLASELFNEEIRHIIIPIGPGHWRGMYLTKPLEDGLFYDLELFDPYGPAGAYAIDSYTLNLLEQCNLPREFIRIRHTGPAHPQGDAYSCGDFTNAYSHKKMKEFGASEVHYNETLVATLDNFGNKDNVLRFMTREETKKLSEAIVVKSEPMNHPVADNSDTANKAKAVIKNNKAAPKLSHYDAMPEPSASTHRALSMLRMPEIKNAEIPTKQSNNPPPNKRFETEVSGIAGGMLFGSLVGGLVGFFGLPVIAALAGAALGAALGTLVSVTIVGVTRLFEAKPSVSKTAPNDTTAAKSTNPYSSTYDSAPQYEQDLGGEPIISPPLFSRVINKTPLDSQNNVKEVSSSGPSFI